MPFYSMRMLLIALLAKEVIYPVAQQYSRTWSLKLGCLQVNNKASTGFASIFFADFIGDVSNSYDGRLRLRVTVV